MAIKTSKSNEGYFAKYKAKYPLNREKRLRRLIKEQPNNKQLEVALKDMSYKRKTPKNKEWSKTQRETAIIMKQFTGKFNKLYFNPDPKINSAGTHDRVDAYFETVKKLQVSPMNAKFPFSIGARAHDKQGNYVWA
ncbi:MAG TPA: hypothetical protein V6C58_28335 [Allocoleopsis sp.]